MSGWRLKLVLIMLLTLSLSLATAISQDGVTTVERTSYRPSDAMETAQSTHAPILITSNEDFEAQGWPGNGTASNPYVISGLHIGTSEVAINITNTDAHFVIEDCVLVNQVDRTDLVTGIGLTNITSGTIRNCTTIGFTWSILATEVTDLLCGNIDARDCMLPVAITSGNDIVVRESEFTSCDMGVYLLQSTNVTVEECRGDAQYFFFGSSLCKDCNVSRNVATISDSGPMFDCGGRNVRFSNNALGRGGIIVGFQQDSWPYEMVNNTVLGRPILYLDDALHVSVPQGEYGQVIVADSEYVEITDLSFSDVDIPILIGHSYGVAVSGVQVGGAARGIYVETTRNLSIVNSTFDRCFVGIDMSNPMIATVSGCVFIDDFTGISTRYDYQNTIEQCNFTGGYPLSEGPEKYEDIVPPVTSGPAAIWAQQSEQLAVRYNRMSNASAGLVGVSLRDFNIQENTIFGCNGSGIMLKYSTQGLIRFNNITDNKAYGVTLDNFCTYVRIWGNVFARNTMGNGHDDGTYNSWDDGREVGNSWDDYGGEGSYRVPGTGASIDSYPFPVDSDGDGLIDYLENNVYGTDPLNPDTDGGGENDLAEIQAGKDPLDPSDDLLSYSVEIPLLEMVALAGIVVTVVVAFRWFLASRRASGISAPEIVDGALWSG